MIPVQEVVLTPGPYAYYWWPVRYRKKSLSFIFLVSFRFLVNIVNAFLLCKLLAPTEIEIYEAQTHTKVLGSNFYFRVTIEHYLKTQFFTTLLH